MNIDNKVIDRIHKLLALAASGNEHESRAAAEKANELLVRYNLDAQTVRAAAGSSLDDYESRVGYQAPLRTPQQAFILPLLVGHFFIRVLHSRTLTGGPVTFYFIGTKTNVAVASYVHDFLLAKYPELWRAYQARTGAARNTRQSYWTGLTSGLRSQLEAKRQAVEQERGLVLVTDPNLERSLRHFHQNVRSFGGFGTTATDAEAVAAGVKDGEALRIQHSLERKGPAGAPTLRLTGSK